MQKHWKHPENTFCSVEVYKSEDGYIILENERYDDLKIDGKWIHTSPCLANAMYKATELAVMMGIAEWLPATYVPITRIK